MRRIHSTVCKIIVVKSLLNLNRFFNALLYTCSQKVSCSNIHRWFHIFNNNMQHDFSLLFSSVYDCVYQVNQVSADYVIVWGIFLRNWIRDIELNKFELTQ